MEITTIDYARERRCNFQRSVFQQCLRDLLFHSAASAPRAATSGTRTRSANARIDLRSSMSADRFCHTSSPAVSGRVGQADLIKNAPNDRINDGGNGTWPAIERGDRWQNNCSCLEQRHDIAPVNYVPRRLARNEDQFPPLLQKNVSRAQQRTIAEAGRDPPERGH